MTVEFSIWLPFYFWNKPVWWFRAAIDRFLGGFQLVLIVLGFSVRIVFDWKDLRKGAA